MYLSSWLFENCSLDLNVRVCAVRVTCIGNEASVISHSPKPQHYSRFRLVIIRVGHAPGRRGPVWVSLVVGVL